jgi:circadian clock protein KaiC
MLKRLPTEVPGLDTILGGGLFEGGVYIFEGSPGVGKTTLANQIAYVHARKGTTTLYVTMLAESHARMLQHMDEQTFFDRKYVNSKVFYLSGYKDLEQGGLKGVVSLLRGEIKRSGASLLIVDGLVVEGEQRNTGDVVRQFVHELQSLVSAMSCTCLVLTSGRGSVLSAEQTMVDGIFAFEDRSFHWRAERRIQVRKFRGSRVIRGDHTFCITDEGLRFFPRLEALPAEDAGTASSPRLVISTGLPSLDAVLRVGGLYSGSNSILIGQSGTGKTSAALAFAGQSDLEEPGLLLACTESAEELRRLGTELGLAVGEAVDSGALTIEELGREDESMDEMGHKLLRMVDELKVRRLVVDGLAGLADTLAFPERGYRFLGRLLSELKKRGITSIFTVDPDALAVAAATPLAEGVVGWFDNAFTLARGEGRDGRGARALKVMKVRGGGAKEPIVDIQLLPREATGDSEASRKGN